MNNLLSWVVVAHYAIQRAEAVHDGSALLSVVIALAFTALGSLATIRFIRRSPVVQPEEKSPTESWFRRVLGWLGVLVWCLAGCAWNLAVAGCLARAARDGNAFIVLLLIPFSLVGWLLLLLLFVSIGVAIESVFGQEKIVKEDHEV